MAHRWYSRAGRFRALASEFLRRGFYPEACFFAQQSAEFYLKGKLIEVTGARLYTHSILQLLTVLYQTLGRELSEELVRCAKYLTEQYIGSRYPDARMLEYDKDDAEQCIKCMEMIFTNVF
ncbi:HEPN domain-containing protein [Pyrobaculum aerophilum]|uniref:HEPN domain-containing protein n=2 Tax=Pyrobaculum aerophilum TaxID=13773 RepID=Q8ZUY4_PYRAE|nr:MULTISPECIES: HEPN domain-containing protein [Pyrobaculum]AAL64272.1 conserved hypothetical protein [Pyrobaculum aerophilum str. IM2]MCX8137705.1 HEPN domain-containing protein [Pyrobaculum aerophilum]HII45912.1 HEPN domain-containing protein [Pyrobaculum aerophilum]